MRRIREALEGRAVLIPFTAERVDMYLVAGGCKTMCADIAYFEERVVKLITCDEDADAFIDFIRKINDKPRSG